MDKSWTTNNPKCEVCGFNFRPVVGKSGVFWRSCDNCEAVRRQKEDEELRKEELKEYKWQRRVVKKRVDEYQQSSVPPEEARRNRNSNGAWRSQIPYSFKRYYRSERFRNKWNMYTKVPLNFVAHLSATADEYNQHYARFLLEAVVSQLNMSVKTREDITQTKAKKSPKIRIGRRKYYLVSS
jgi:hypothetical protein